MKVRLNVEVRPWQALLALVACFVLVAAAFPQGIATGTMSGTILDPSGATIPNAKITVVNASTNTPATAETNGDGFFTIRNLPPGSYKVTVESGSFRTAVLDKIDVFVSRETDLGSIKLELGKLGETVTVEGAAPIVESTTSQVTTNFDAKTVADLPLSGSFDALALFIPGIADSGDNSFSNNNGASFSSNGLRGRSNNFQIDGQSNNDNSVAGPSIFLGNQDALDEVTVITNDFGVEYGRASGSVVNYVTKSGTNDWHGSAFDYYLGSWADSHDNGEINPVFGFCAKVNPAPGCNAVAPVPRFVENKFGGSFGGPIKKNKAWFFFTPYFDRQRSAGAPTPSSTLTPTPNGLTQLAAAFPNNPAVAALNAIGPYAVKAGNPTPSGTPKPIVVSDGVTSAPIEFADVTRSVPSLFNDREFTGRVDVQVTSKDRIGARYIFQHNILTGATGNFAGGGWVDIPAQDQQIALDWVHTFSTALLNQTRYSFSRAGFGFEGGSFPKCTRASITSCPTSIGFPSGFLTFGIQNNLPQGRTINNTQVQDNASYFRGKHTFKFGGEFYKQRSPNTFLPNINGSYLFESFDRFLQNSLAPPPGSATRGRLSLTDGPTKFNFKEYDIAAYAGDDYRLKDNLTVNLGLRWEYSSQAINLLHDLSVKNQAGANPFWDPTAPTNVTTVPSIPNQYHYFGPTVGFAWKPRLLFLKGDKTVIRGGYRITYDPAYYNMFLNVATAAPVVNAGTLRSATCTAPCLVTSGFTGNDVRAAHLSDIPRGVNPGTRNNTRLAPNFHEPMTQEWSLGVQREITSKAVFEVRYVGNHVTGNFQTVNGNPSLDGLIAGGFSSLIPAGITPCTTPGAPGFADGRVDCNFTNVRNRENTAWSRYNGLQTQLRVQSWHGLSGAGSFTFSKTLDNSSEIFSTGAGGNTVAGAQNPFDISRGEKALSGLDFPKTASLYVVYELPFYKGQQGWLGRLLGGYQANATWRFSSGQLWTPTLVNPNSACQDNYDATFFAGLSTCRPFLGSSAAPVDTVGLCTNAAAPDCGLVDYYAFTLNAVNNPVSKSAVRWIYNDDTAAAFFKTPYGNVGRNPGVRGQAVNTVNMSLFKTTKITERFSLRLEAQAYNLFNHLFLGVPDPNIDDLNIANGGSFGNNFFNTNGGTNPNALNSGYTNAVLSGLGRRRIVLGAKVSF